MTQILHLVWTENIHYRVITGYGVNTGAAGAGFANNLQLIQKYKICVVNPHIFIPNKRRTNPI